MSNFLMGNLPSGTELFLKPLKRFLLSFKLSGLKTGRLCHGYTSLTSCADVINHDVVHNVTGRVFDLDLEVSGW